MNWYKKAIKYRQGLWAVVFADSGKVAEDNNGQGYNYYDAVEKMMEMREHGTDFALRPVNNEDKK